MFDNNEPGIEDLAVHQIRLEVLNQLCASPVRTRRSTSLVAIVSSLTAFLMSLNPWAESIVLINISQANALLPIPGSAGGSLAKRCSLRGVEAVDGNKPQMRLLGEAAVRHSTPRDNGEQLWLGQVSLAS